ncbi:MAG: DUF2085 domain-containing protein [Chloroflexota bacterium]|nr:DUF2085 domain-containing protein [Chloroflexota bacterium]
MASLARSPVLHRIGPFPGSALLTVGLSLLLFLALPWSIEHKAHMVLHGLCAQRPSHSYYFGDRALPFDARMTGIYLGYLATTMVLFRAGAHRRCRQPSLGRIAILMALGGVMVVDGFNSLLRDLELPHPYEPMNWLRVLTGYTAGIVLAVALCFLIASTLWKEVDTRTETLESLRVIPVSLAMLVPVGLLVGSGWGPLFVPLSLVLIAAALLALSSLALVVIVILTRRDFTYRSVSDLDRIAAVAVVAGVAVMLSLAGGRAIVERLTGPGSLT